MSQVKYLIIGGSHAGLCALEAIRFQDEEGEIAMVSREQSLPYSPTILPYVISGKKQTDTILLRDESYFTDLNVQFMPGSTVVAVNPAETTVALQSWSPPFVRQQSDRVARNYWDRDRGRAIVERENRVSLLPA